MARLDAEGGQAGFVAAVNTGGGSLTIVPAALLAAEQKSMELWLIPPGDKPHSLGLIDPNTPGDDQGAEGTSVASQQRSRACGFARAAWRLADRPADGSRDR